MSITKRIKEYFKKPYVHKATFSNRISMTYNFVWAIIKLIGAYILSSVFISLSGFYTIFIGLAKMAYFDGRRNSKSFTDEKIYYKRIAFALLIAGLCYMFYFLEFFNYDNSNTYYDIIVGIVIALISCIEIFLSIRGLIKSKKTNDFLLTGLKFINLCGALSSVVLTQIAILSTQVGEKNFIFYNTVIGTVVGIATIAIAIYMFISCKYHIQKIYPVLKNNTILTLKSQKNTKKYVNYVLKGKKI